MRSVTDFLPEFAEPFAAVERADEELSAVRERLNVAARAVQDAKDEDRRLLQEAVAARGSKKPKATAPGAQAALEQVAAEVSAHEAVRRQRVHEVAEVARGLLPGAWNRLDDELALAQKAAMQALDAAEQAIRRAFAIRACAYWIEDPVRGGEVRGLGKTNWPTGIEAARGAVTQIARHQRGESDEQRRKRETGEIDLLKQRALKLAREAGMDPAVRDWPEPSGVEKAEAVRKHMEPFYAQARRELGDELGRELPELPPIYNPERAGYRDSGTALWPSDKESTRALEESMTHKPARR
jgi:hypothetical protein